jgi:two-component system response regulator AtoC
MSKVLIVDDDLSFCQTLERGLSRRGFELASQQGGEQALMWLGEHDVDVVLTDLRMRGMDGLALCERVAANRSDVPVVVITAFGNYETAVAAMRAGAYDFVSKPVDLDQLAFTLERAAKHRALTEEVKRLRKNGKPDGQRHQELLGSSVAMHKVHELIDRVADSETSVLLTGESGTGKEVVARAIHRASSRRDGPFVAINCAAIPEALLESELFGHLKGAFTDAHANRTGLLAQASGGTLFLDEIGELPVALQPKLLRAVQERKVRPVGADEEVPFDTRVICATNIDLDAAVEEGRFRNDLYFRINVVQIELPPLRARGMDVLTLAQHFVEKYAKQAGKAMTGISKNAAERLLEYSWPGNVRELQSCIERAVALAQFEEILVDDLPDRIRRYRRSQIVLSSDDPGELVPLEEVERRYIMRVLEACGWRRMEAARILKLDRKTLYRKLERYGVRPHRNNNAAAAATADATETPTPTPTTSSS